MGNPIVGHVKCPHCGNPDATVHQEKKGKRSLYYRCYGGPKGDCGTVQIRYPGGQQWIKDNMRPLDLEQQDDAANEAAGEAAEEAREQARDVRRQAAGNSGVLATMQKGLKSLLSDEAAEQ